jgi:Flp pilus assembly protein TadD
MRRQVINAVDAGDGDIEIRELRTRVAANPEDLNARLELARRYNGLGYPELAADHCRVAAERFPSSPEVQEMLAASLRRANLPKDAAANIEKYLAAAKPATPVLYSWLGILRDDLNQYAAAEQAHRKAIELKPDNDVFHNNLGQNLLLQGRKDEAAAEFRQAIKLNPRSEIARNNLAVAVASQPREAILVLESGSDPATAHNNLAAVLIEERKYQEARKELEIALGYRRDFPAALSNLSLISQADGKPVTLPANMKQNESFWKRVSRSLGNAVLGEDVKQSQESGAGHTASR